MLYAPYGVPVYGGSLYAGLPGVLAVAIEGVTVTPVPTGLPHLRVSWDQVVPLGGETFLRYQVYRRQAVHTDVFGLAVPAGQWMRIARIPAIGTVQYLDHHVASGVTYDYAVTWVGDDGTTVRESDRQADTATDSGAVSWVGLYLHDVAAPAYFTRVYSPRISVPQRQDQVERRARGRRVGTTFTGEGFSRVYQVDVIPYAIHEQEEWQRLRALADRQYRSRATYCFRSSYSQEVVFGVIEGLQREDRPAVTQPSFSFRESHYSEAV